VGAGLGSAVLLLIRHGQQAPDERGEVGRASVLNPLGRLQAAELARELFAGPEIAAVYASPLPRAAETAQLLCQRLGLAPRLDPRLAEFELGTRPIEGIGERDDLLIWRPEHEGADGVTLGAFAARVAAFCEEATARHLGQRVAVVSHAGTIDAALRWALGMGADSDWQHEAEVRHASITEIEFWPRGRIAGGAPRYAVLRRLDCVEHLRGLASDL
jgi:probable phosphoglycerate mutase